MYAFYLSDALARTLTSFWPLFFGFHRFKQKHKNHVRSWTVLPVCELIDPLHKLFRKPEAKGRSANADELKLADVKDVQFLHNCRSFGVLVPDSKLFYCFEQKIGRPKSYLPFTGTRGVHHTHAPTNYRCWCNILRFWMQGWLSHEPSISGVRHLP
jgi:hypothetical protein